LVAYIGFLLMTSFGVRAETENALAAARACTTEPDDAVRLACYDRSLRRVPAKTAPVAASAAAKAPVAAAGAASAEQQFGMTEALARKQGTPAPPPHADKLQSKVVAVSHKLRGQPVVKLEDGQVWEVVEGEAPLDIKSGDTVTIYPGTLGSYRLTAGGAYVRVHRVQ
jgi:hypothetical protein